MHRGNCSKQLKLTETARRNGIAKYIDKSSLFFVLYNFIPTTNWITVGALVELQVLVFILN